MSISLMMGHHVYSLHDLLNSMGGRQEMEYGLEIRGGGAPCKKISLDSRSTGASSGLEMKPRSSGLLCSKK